MTEIIASGISFQFLFYISAEKNGLAPPLIKNLKKEKEKRDTTCVFFDKWVVKHADQK